MLRPAGAALARSAAGAAWALAATPRPGAAGPRNPKVRRRAAPSRRRKYATTYNNYYEFSEGKDLWRGGAGAEAAAVDDQPGGHGDEPRTIAIDDLLKQVQLEERVYRHRCVEAWAMTVPWTGFPLSQLLKLAEPLGSAKYVVFETAAGQDDAGPELAVLSLAVHRGAGDRRGGQRPGVHLDRAVRQAAAAAERRADPADDCRGNTASSRPRRWSRSASPTSGR